MILKNVLISELMWRGWNCIVMIIVFISSSLTMIYVSEELTLATVQIFSTCLYSVKGKEDPKNEQMCVGGVRKTRGGGGGGGWNEGRGREEGRWRTDGRGYAWLKGARWEEADRGVQCVFTPTSPHAENVFKTSVHLPSRSSSPSFSLTSHNSLFVK